MGNYCKLFIPGLSISHEVPAVRLGRTVDFLLGVREPGNNLPDPLEGLFCYSNLGLRPYLFVSDAGAGRTLRGACEFKGIERLNILLPVLYSLAAGYSEVIATASFETISGDVDHFLWLSDSEGVRRVTVAGHSDATTKYAWRWTPRHQLPLYEQRGGSAR